MTPHDPFTGARVTTGKLDPKDPRGGVPAEKFGTVAMPLRTPEKRQAVMLMLYPPEALRDQPLDVIEAAIDAAEIVEARDRCVLNGARRNAR